VLINVPADATKLEIALSYGKTQTFPSEQMLILLLLPLELSVVVE
jgi:hypothetical protein